MLYIYTTLQYSPFLCCDVLSSCPPWYPTTSMPVAFLDLPPEVLLEIIGYASFGDTPAPMMSGTVPHLTSFGAKVSNKGRVQALAALRL